MLVMSSHCPPCQLEPLWRDVSVVCQRKLLGLGWVWVVNSSSLSQKSQNPIKIKRWSNIMYHIHNICTSPFRSKKHLPLYTRNQPTKQPHTSAPKVVGPADLQRLPTTEEVSRFRRRAAVVALGYWLLLLPKAMMPFMVTWRCEGRGNFGRFFLLVGMGGAKPTTAIVFCFFFSEV